MRITLKTLVILLLAALMPLRAVAAVTIGLCAAAHDEPAIAAHADTGHGSGAQEHHDSDDSPAKSTTPSCSACVEHCSGAAFAPSAAQALSAPAVAQDRIQFAGRVAPAFRSDPLDRPPLA